MGHQCPLRNKFCLLFRNSPLFYSSQTNYALWNHSKWHQFLLRSHCMTPTSYEATPNSATAGGNTHLVLYRVCWRLWRRWLRSWCGGRAPGGQVAALAATCASVWTLASCQPEPRTGPASTASAAAKSPPPATRGRDLTSRTICLQKITRFVHWTGRFIQPSLSGQCFISSEKCGYKYILTLTLP